MCDEVSEITAGKAGRLYISICVLCTYTQTTIYVCIHTLAFTLLEKVLISRSPDIQVWRKKKVCVQTCTYDGRCSPGEVMLPGR